MKFVTGVFRALIAFGLCGGALARAQEPVGFTSDVVPILTRLGCNAGGCHGKAEGQNGFKLSLFGFEPDDDIGYLRQDALGRRLNLHDPDQSLLLLKATGSVPHGGGALTHRGSLYYQTLARWMSQGARKTSPGESPVVRIEMTPPSSVIQPGGKVKVAVTAFFQNGTKRVVTHLAQFKAEPADSISIDDEAVVMVGQHPVSGSVMARYQDQVAVATIMVPLGAPVGALPPTNNFIDEFIFKRLKTMGLPPSPVCDDGTFIRRTTIDIAGRLPLKEEVEAFLADKSHQRHEKLIDRLLATDDYAYLFANKWGAVLRNRRNPGDDRKGTLAFHDWIFKSLKANRPFDQFAREVLTATGEEGTVAPIVWYRELKDANSLAEDSAQLFLGQRVQCARCHHHPSERWSQADYWGLAAFFARTDVKLPNPKKGNNKKKDAPKEPDRPIVALKSGEASLPHPRTGVPVKAAGLGSSPVDLAADADPRAALADWMTDSKNPFFAKALVNRYWKHFLGRGLVEPEDDMRATNPPTNPELLDALAKHFVASKYDLKSLVRVTCLSSTYRLDCEPNAHNGSDRQHYARFYVRRLPAEVLFDAIDQVTLSKPNIGAARAIQLPDNQFESYFLRAFGRPEAASACECERGNGQSLAQALHLFNSDELLTKIGGPVQPNVGVDASAPANKNSKKPTASSQPKTNPGARLGKIVADPRPHDAKIRDLFLIAFARQASTEEVTRLVAHIERRGNLESAYSDILWALLNSSEFAFNH